MEIEDKLDYIFVEYDNNILQGYNIGTIYIGTIFGLPALILDTLITNGWYINNESHSDNRLSRIENHYNIKLNKREYEGLHYNTDRILLIIPNNLIKHFIKEIEIIRNTTDTEIILYILETIKNKINESK